MLTTFDTANIPLELDHREGDGISVSLIWRKTGNIVSIAVRDERTGDDFELVVAPDRALDAFSHPYAYAASDSLLEPTGPSRSTPERRSEERRRARP